jgi:DNA (cytosine-5)-methyltransferase 1
MKHGSLFSGIGGFDLASEWMGWENVFHCEWNDFGKKVLKYYWPKAISYDDITKTDFTIHRGSIDILTGGFPCQPYSTAGKRLGKEDERHLWPEMLRAIREIQPRWIVGENVLGLVNWNGGLVFEEVQADLENEGYEVQPFILPAVSVNAPHRRDRVWFVAYSTRSNKRANQFQGVRCKNAEINRERSQTIYNAFGSDGGEGYATNTNNQGLQRSENIGSIGKNRESRNKFFTRLFQSNWQNFPTVAPICDGNDGLSNQLDGITFSKWRNESIKAGGNAIVPQVVLQIFKAIEQYELD